MLTNVFRRLHLSGSEATVNLPSGGVIEGGLKASTRDSSSSSATFLNLPIDVLVLFLNYLRTRDLIALSLTTKKLRWVRPAIDSLADDDLPDTLNIRIPPRVKSLLQDQKKAEARCSHRIHQRFLPPSKISHDKCPYCAHPLCPPSCPTALFLDTLSGVFYPAQFYHTNKAVFKYSTNIVQKLLFNSHVPTRTVGEDKTQKVVYSTIWCEHHRCPRNLFSSSGPSFLNSPLSTGAHKFLTEYTQTASELQWRTVCSSKDLGHWVHDRWRVGYRPPSQNPLEKPPGSTTSNTVSPKPVHEAYTYSLLCLHCLRSASCQMIGSLPTPYEYSCFCEYIGNRKGCVRCGVTTVRFTRIEVFDLPNDQTLANTGTTRKYVLPREGFWLYVATDYRVGPSPNPNAPEPRRLYPVDVQRNNQLLSIVRGFEIIPLPPQPKIRLQDLPYSILQKIVLILNPMDPLRYIRFEESEYFCFSASYCFIKAAHGRMAPLRSLDYLKEPWYLMCSGRQGGFNSTEVFWKGQMDAKVREEQWKATRIAWSMGTGLRDLLAQK
ncbi:hypothetical protein TWF106_002861 [Orbilia oligospora]|uniref:F-box domain-containing protein n=1 Tax=Orbilia oligospora TaxID=2813651 RepID=A0A6G1M0L9_ORBOL|nr:hypothetical protein TWF106_002861 [Orbilia oligospora]KAF3218018.1 hypothetical protein TWF679_001430 [Orbilia oligospora]KAF3218692.1 hypothetical protein TWF191_008138 [Orbilia oligospora]KAF3239240.1 hypothetical protein TWF192_010115 [Orbilia oligospora]